MEYDKKYDMKICKIQNMIKKYDKVFSGFRNMIKTNMIKNINFSKYDKKMNLLTAKAQPASRCTLERSLGTFSIKSNLPLHYCLSLKSRPIAVGRD